MSMRVNRRFLYWGVFLVAIGAVLVAADVGRLDSEAIADILRLWPLAFVAIGIGIALRRTRFSLPSGVLAAAVPGLLLGGGFALVPRIAADCGATEAASTVAAREGVFDGPARIAVTAGCGSLVVTTAPGRRLAVRCRRRLPDERRSSTRRRDPSRSKVAWVRAGVASVSAVTTGV